MLGNKLLNIQFAKYHIWNNKSEGFPNMVLSTETFNQSVRTEYSEAVKAHYTFQPLWVSGNNKLICYIAEFSPPTARALIGYTVLRGHMTSNNKTASHQKSLSGQQCKSMMSEGNSALLLANVGR